MSGLVLTQTYDTGLTLDWPGDAPVVIRQPEAEDLALLSIVAVTQGSYTHSQPTPALTWVINHNLGFQPAVELYDIGGREFDAEIVHTSSNQVVVYLTTPTAGTARLN